MFRLGAGQIYRVDALTQLPWMEHGFGTRLSSHWPDSSNVATARQVHSSRVLFVQQPGNCGEGDALISNVPGITLAIRTADCLPVLIADQRSRAVAAVHAGWRGTALGIVPETIRVMTERFGTRVEDLVIAIGPGIGECCYEVGPEVTARFAHFFPERSDMAGSARVDLAETTLRQLRRNGGSLGQIATSRLCRYCLADLFHSYRRDREAAGRMVTAIRIRTVAE